MLRTDHGTYAIRYAGMGELRQVEQWYRMNLAQDFTDWKEAMRMMTFASFNFVYADKEGNIMFLHNALTPKRDIRYDWQSYLPGDDSALIWQENLSFSQMPQVANPDSGFVFSANQTPFNVTAAAENPKESALAPEHGFQQDMSNRAHRGLELFAALGPMISKEEFSAIKHDKFYSRSTFYVAYLDTIAVQSFTDPSLQRAQQVLAQWDLGTDVDNTGAALGSNVTEVFCTRVVTSKTTDDQSAPLEWAFITLVFRAQDDRCVCCADSHDVCTTVNLQYRSSLVSPVRSLKPLHFNTSLNSERRCCERVAVL